MHGQNYQKEQKKMTNREWIDLIAKEFNVSNSMAKHMLHGMYEAKKYFSVSKDIRKKQKEEDIKFKKMCEREYIEEIIDNLMLKKY